MAAALYYKKHNVVYIIDIYGHLCCSYEVYYSKKFCNLYLVVCGLLTYKTNAVLVVHC